MNPIKITHLDLKQIAESGQCFTWQALSEKRYAVRSGARYVEAEQQNDMLMLSCTDDEFKAFWQGYFDLETDYGAWIESVDPEDTYLSAAARYGAGMRILRQDLWEVMVSFLISQNNNVTRIGNSVRGLCETYGRIHRTREGTVFRAFPQPDDLAEAGAAEFAALGLGYRARYLEALVATMRDGGLADFREALTHADDDTAHAKLMELTGIGRKVADCISLYGLHRIDRFPIDTHIRQILEKHYVEGFPYERYKGYLGVIQQYLFYYKLTAKT